MVASMTGFGRSFKESALLSVTVEIKTVNHRFCEFYMRIPRQLSKIEDKLKKKLSEYIQRGRVEVFVTMSGEAVLNRKLQIDWHLLEQYHQYISEIKQKYGLTGEISLQELMTKEEIVTIEESESEDDEFVYLVLAAIDDAAMQLKQMRQTEGIALHQDISGRLALINQRVKRLTELAPVVVQHYQERLTKRMQDFLSGQVDEARILTEVAIFSDKVDIHEELTRLESHSQQFQKYCC